MNGPLNLDALIVYGLEGAQLTDDAIRIWADELGVVVERLVASAQEFNEAGTIAATPAWPYRCRSYRHYRLNRARRPGRR